MEKWAVSHGGLRTGCFAAKEDGVTETRGDSSQSFSAGEGAGDADEPGWRDAVVEVPLRTPREAAEALVRKQAATRLGEGEYVGVCGVLAACGT